MLRKLHTVPPRLKNQYYYYDLGSRQPKSDQALLETKGRRVFDPTKDASKETMQERVQKVFGSLGSREESRKEAMAKGARVLGVYVPARPEEPTNCCQSGCINCVWELYRDEIEEWRHARKKAQLLLMKPENLQRPWPPILGAEPKARRDGHEPSKVEPEQEDEGQDKLNIGIQAFIETEKRLHRKKKLNKQTTSASSA